MNKQAKIHIVLTLSWALMIIPTLIWFKDSVLWVAVISIYALVASHWSAYEAARAGVQEGTLRQIRALTEAMMALMLAYQRDNPDDQLDYEIDELRDALDEEHD